MPAKDEQTPLVSVSFTMHVPEEVRRKLRLAIMAARDAGESWASLESRTLIDMSNLVKMTKGKRYIGPHTAVRLAQALGFELQMTIVKRKKKAA